MEEAAMFFKRLVMISKQVDIPLRAAFNEVKGYSEMKFLFPSYSPHPHSNSFKNKNSLSNGDPKTGG